MNPAGCSSKEGVSPHLYKKFYDFNVTMTKRRPQRSLAFEVWKVDIIHVRQAQLAQVQIAMAGSKVQWQLCEQVNLGEGRGGMEVCDHEEPGIIIVRGDG